MFWTLSDILTTPSISIQKHPVNFFPALVARGVSQARRRCHRSAKIANTTVSLDNHWGTGVNLFAPAIIANISTRQADIYTTLLQLGIPLVIRRELLGIPIRPAAVGLPNIWQWVTEAMEASLGTKLQFDMPGTIHQWEWYATSGVTTPGRNETAIFEDQKWAGVFRLLISNGVHANGAVALETDLYGDVQMGSYVL